MNEAHPGLTFATLDPHDETDPARERLHGWAEAMSRGFHGGRVSDDLRTHWLEHVRTDEATIRGAWPDTPALGSGRIPVATFTSFDKTMNVGGGQLLPLRMITDVTVSPTHRRRGLLRTLMTEDLQDARDRGVPLAGLTVSEGSIYGRFGFGLATVLRHVEVDTTSRFALRGPAGDGEVVLLEPEEAWPVVESVFDSFHASTRGSVARPRFYRTMLTGAFDFDFDEGGSADRTLRVAVHVDDAGRPDGYVAYRPARDEGKRVVDVRDLVALTPAGYLRLWRFLADLDLVQRVRWRSSPVHDPLEWALVDPFAVKATGVDDMLWVRVLDVVAALSARPWGADDSLVLEVDDPLGHAAGRFRVSTRRGQADVVPTGETADVALSADTLGALYLGGVTVATLAAAGRIGGTPEAVGRFALVADTGPAPYCITAF